MSEFLKCPSTGKACEFQAYCAADKAEVDGGVNPHEFVGGVQISSQHPQIWGSFIDEFCSIRRIKSLSGAASNEIGPDRYASKATELVVQLLKDRDPFRSS